jgi:putative ATP-binding cassette transporter
MIGDVWQKVAKKPFYIFLSLLLTITIAEIVLTVLIPVWREIFYSALQKFDQPAFWTAMLYGAILMIGFGTIQGLKTFVRLKFSFTIREAMSKLFLKTWVYDNKKEDPRFNIALTDAIKISTDNLTDVLVESFVSFVIVIILIINATDQPILLLAALGYTVVVSLVAYLFNTPLIRTDTELQVAEGHYRNSIAIIAINGGDHTAKNNWLAIKDKFHQYLLVLTGFNLFSRAKGALASLIPYFLLFDEYFSRQIDLGGFMNGVSTFELIVVNTTILVIVYPQITKALASYNICKEFYSGIKKKEIEV